MHDFTDMPGNVNAGLPRALTPRQRWSILVEQFAWLQKVAPGFGLCEPAATMPALLSDDILAALCRPEVAMAFIEALEAAIDCRVRRFVGEAVFDHEQRPDVAADDLGANSEHLNALIDARVRRVLEDRRTAE